MAPAAQRVFGIVELLEYILLLTREKSMDAIDVAHSKWLFSAQGVSCSFKDTINASAKLRCRMGIAFYASSGMRRLSRSIISSYLRQQQLSLTGLTYEELFEQRGQFDVPVFITFKFDASGKLSNDSSNLPCPAFVGKSGRRYGNSVHSWRKLKITSVDVPIIVKVKVIFSNPFKPAGMLSKRPTYVECLHYVRGYDTLGDIANALSVISQRRLLQHAAVVALVEHNEWKHLTHETVQCFLESISKLDAWMKLEKHPAVTRLKDGPGITESCRCAIDLVDMNDFRVAEVWQKLKRLVAAEEGGGCETVRKFAAKAIDKIVGVVLIALVTVSSLWLVWTVLTFETSEE